MKKLLIIITAVTIVNTSHTISQDALLASMVAQHLVAKKVTTPDQDSSTTLVMNTWDHVNTAHAVKSVAAKLSSESNPQLKKCFNDIATNPRFARSFIGFNLLKTLYSYHRESLVKKGATSFTGALSGVEKRVLGSSFLSDKLSAVHNTYQKTPKVLQAVGNFAGDVAISAALAKASYLIIR